MGAVVTIIAGDAQAPGRAPSPLNRGSEGPAGASLRGGTPSGQQVDRDPAIRGTAA